MRQGSSGLTLREIQVYQQPTFELTPRKVTQWVKNLPIANLGESSKRIYRLLVESNQSLLDADKRLAILNIVEPVANDIASALEKQFIHNRIALTEKQRKVAALVQALQTELCIGYNTVIESIVSDDIKRSHKKLLAVALTLAVRYHGLVIFRCYQLYASIPRRIWHELYKLYQIAMAHELLEAKVNHEHSNSVLTVQECFIQIMLLSTANPYQLRQREIELLWHTLAKLTGHVSLMSHAYNKQHFVIDLNASTPPIHKSLYKKNEGQHTLKLTAYTAVEPMKQMLAAITKSDQQSLRQAMLLRHLIQCWSQGVNRAFARTPCKGSAHVSFGLGSTHYLLAQETAAGENTDTDGTTLEAMEGSLKHATLTDVAKRKKNAAKLDYDYLSSSGPPDSDVWAKLYRTDHEREVETQKQAAEMRTHDTIVADNYKFQEVQLTNMSPNGFCIQLAAEELPPHAQTGEILGFMEHDGRENANWNIAVVRWVRRHPAGNLVQLGIQLLAPGATPVTIQLRNSRGESNKFQRALKLPALTGVGQPQTILTNPISFSTNRKVRIIDNGDKYDARLLKEVAATSSYRQFEYEKLNTGTKAESKPQKSESSLIDPQELDGIWDLF